MEDESAAAFQMPLTHDKELSKMVHHLLEVHPACLTKTVQISSLCWCVSRQVISKASDKRSQSHLLQLNALILELSQQYSSQLNSMPAVKGR